MSEADLLALISQATEFENVKVRDEELPELDRLLEDCVCDVKGGTENAYGKVNILLQTHISRGRVDDFSLVSDTAYVVQNASRILRGVFEIALRKSLVRTTAKLLELSKTVERRLWPFEHPLAQFPLLPFEVLQKLSTGNVPLDRLRDMEADEIGHLIRHTRMGKVVLNYVEQFPRLAMDASVQPITRSILRVELVIRADFEWNDRVHGTVEPWWIWTEDADNEHFHHTEYFLLHKKQKDDEHRLVFTIPIFEPLPTQYFVKAVSDRWLGAELTIPLSFQHLLLPEKHPPHTDLLGLQPLPITALQDETLEALYAPQFMHFNPIQTQIFHTLYHTDGNVLLGAPTGSGKTIAAEIAMWRAFRVYPSSKVVYVAPLKALVRERVLDWSQRVCPKIGKRLVELTGDLTPDLQSLQRADIIVTTPEKWDSVSRSWQDRDYVRAVSLVIIDEIHMLGQDRGPTLEVIVSRMNYMSAHVKRPVRLVGLSTALANAQDVAAWLGVEKGGLFNFRPSVRPVPLEVHISGFSGKHYCPRMATMNKPAYSAIKTYSPNKPVIIFVASRRQTRLTAQELISLCGVEDNPRQFLTMRDEDLQPILAQLRDENLKLSLPFGIGLHHAGLVDTDRRTVEELFVNRKIQILVATSTLAWGVNSPTHLVIIKGTEFFDAKAHRYVDMPITDVLQMMGRAGRPQYDDSGIAVVYVQDVKKNFYKKFLYEPFPVESSLHTQLTDHLNAEVVAGTIKSRQDALDYMHWTYYYRRVLMNPSYYGLTDVSADSLNKHLAALIENAFIDLEADGCLEIHDNFEVLPTTLGRIAGHYYLSHKTVGLFHRSLKTAAAKTYSHEQVLTLLCDATEYDELPVRHNEELLNAELMRTVPWPVNALSLESPHVKSHLLLQAHFERAPLPIADYVTDTKMVLDQAVRILQAMVDVAAEKGLLSSTLRMAELMQAIKQGRFPTDHPLLCLPHMNASVLSRVRVHGSQITSLPELMDLAEDAGLSALTAALPAGQAREALAVVARLPIVSVRCALETDAVASGPPTVAPGATLELVIDLARVSRPRGRADRGQASAGSESATPTAYAPRYPKVQTEGWWLICGDMLLDELKAIRRVSFGRRTTVALSIPAPIVPGTYTYTVFVISDVYLGLDQQYDVIFTVASV